MQKLTEAQRALGDFVDRRLFGVEDFLEALIPNPVMQLFWLRETKHLLEVKRAKMWLSFVGHCVIVVLTLTYPPSHIQGILRPTRRAPFSGAPSEDATGRLFPNHLAGWLLIEVQIALNAQAKHPLVVSSQYLGVTCNSNEVLLSV
jgi:hypothetical protein